MLQYLINNLDRMRFRTQREVSEYYGRNPNDRSFISRRIAKGLIARVNGGYEIRDGDPVKSVATKEQLNSKNYEDTAEIIKLHDKINDLEKELDMYKKWYNKNAEDYNKLLSDFEFLNKEYEKLEKKNNSALDKCYQRFVQHKLIDKNEETFDEFFSELMNN